VSLILEALKKLDREKQAPDRGLLVVGPSAWPSLGDGRPGMGAGAAAVGMLVLFGIAGAIWLLRGANAPASTPPAVVTAPAVTAPTQTQPLTTAPAVGQPSGAFPSNVRPAPAPRSAQRAAAGSRTATAAEPIDGSRPEPVAAAGADADAQPEVAGEPSERETAPPPPPAAAATRVKEPRSGAAGGYQLQAISAQDGHPIAILNDRLVREGDTFDGVKVLRIGADEVEIEVGGRRRVVKF
jgi:hypothetical protein